jgi:phasin family protein
MPDLPKFPDFSQFMASMPMPMAPEISALMETHKRNLMALAAANKLIFEGAQAITQRQMEVMRRQITDLTQATTMLATVAEPKERTLRQTELLKGAYEKSVGDLREVEDLLRKSSAEALDLIHSRFVAAMDEVKAAVEKKTA